ncbi:MAG: hypothetical protein H7332_15855 [Bdellovibrionales bacterium]|nr:hypothetical protein [Ramlibacter sp.]
MTHLKHAAFALLALLSVPQAFACYTVYNQSNQIIYNARTPPVDMSYQIHQVLPRVYPGGHMVFGDDPNCPVVSTVYAGGVGRNDTGLQARRLAPKPYRN